MELFMPSGEWDYVSYSVALHNSSDAINTYRTLRYNLCFQRRWLFYSQYLLLPIMMNSVLMICVFLVPLDSGEKLGFSLTVLLAYVVLLTIVTDNLPPISTKTSVLQIYVSVLMVLGTVTTLLSIWVLTLYNKDESQRLSYCLQTFTDYIIAPITCMSCRRKARVDDQPTHVIKQDQITGNGDNENKAVGFERPYSTLPSTQTALGRRQDGRMSCRDFAVVLDTFLFRVAVFSLFVLKLTVVVFFLVKTEKWVRPIT